MLLPLLLIKLNARLSVTVSIFCAATLFMISMERLSTFSHPITLWDDAEKLVKDRQSLPGAGRIYYNRGTEWLKIEKYDKALPDLQTATRLSPSFSSAFGNLGLVFYKTGQNEQAIQAFSRAIELDQEQKAAPNYKNYYARAESYEANGQQLKAAIDYKASCLINSKMGCDKVGLHLP